MSKVKVFFTETQRFGFSGADSDRPVDYLDRFYHVQMTKLPADVHLCRTAVLHMEKRTRRGWTDEWSDPERTRVLIDVPYGQVSDADLIRRAITEFDAFIAVHEMHHE